MKHPRAILLVCCVALVLGACENLSKREIGTGAGAVVGVIVGSMFGSGTGRAVAMAVGGAAGGLAGAAIGAELDKADQLKAYRAAYDVANSETADRVQWISDSKPDVGGYAEPAGPAGVAQDGQLCRTVRSVYVLEGEEQNQTNRFCFKDGRWVAG